MKQQKKSIRQTTTVKSASKKSDFKEDFAPIDDTPENVAMAILSSPPKKSHEWKYLNRKKRN